MLTVFAKLLIFGNLTAIGIVSRLRPCRILRHRMVEKVQDRLGRRPIDVAAQQVVSTVPDGHGPNGMSTVSGPMNNRDRSPLRSLFISRSPTYLSTRRDYEESVVANDRGFLSNCRELDSLFSSKHSQENLIHVAKTYHRQILILAMATVTSWTILIVNLFALFVQTLVIVK